MARIAFILGILMFVTTLGATQASAGSGTGDSHSFEWFRDADGDGIPNGMDDDWSPPEDGTGYQVRNLFGLMGIRTFWGMPLPQRATANSIVIARINRTRPETVSESACSCVTEAANSGHRR